MSGERFFAGVDGGGTKTEIVVVDERGVERARYRTTTCNQSVIGHDAAMATLRAGMQDAALEAGTTLPLTHVWFGLAGFDRGEDHARVAPVLSDIAAAITLTNDAELVLSALPGGVGLAIIAGTGSIAVGRDQLGMGARAGGWGHVFGDEGSGYALGRRALQAAAMMDDGRGPETSLLPRLLAQWRLSSAPQLITRVYGKGATKSEIAALAALVVDAADEGDAVAQTLLDGAARELAVAGLAVIRRLSFDGAVPLALAGGLVQHVPAFADAVARGIARDRPLSTVAVVVDSAFAGARAALERAGVTTGEQ